MKWTLRTFALLDILGMFLLWPLFKNQIGSFTTIQNLTIIIFFSRLLFIVTWLSLGASAFFLYKNKKLGIYIYYFQLPARLIFSIYSLGFIALLSLVSEAVLLNQAIIPLAVIAEICRFYYSYKAENKLD